MGILSSIFGRRYRVAPAIVLGFTIGLTEGDAAPESAPPPPAQAQTANAGAAANPASALPAGPPPNVVIIYADDQGYHDLGCFGAPLNRTPNIDRIAAEGVRFTDFYSAYCVCSASRAALMTGCYQPRISMPGVIGPHSRTALNPDEVTIADLLKTKGYATACVGKWHLGDAPETLPTGQGFDRYFGIPYSNDMARKKGWGNDPEALDRIWREKRWDIYNNELYRDAAVIESPVNQTTLTERYAAEAVKFIEEKKDSPFFLYWANSMPHVPLFVSDDRYDPDPQQAYRLTVEHIDACVGKILDALDRTGAATNTLVVYTSDNGPWLSKKHHAGSALPLRDGKGTTWEGGMRVPCVMRWPARVAPGQECRQVASTIDLLPTLAALTGAALPEGRTIDGLDISALLADPAAPSPHDTAGFFYYKQNEIEAVRLGDWKLKFKVGKPELYNLRDDIGERRDLNKENPEKVGELKALAKAYDERLQAAKRPPWKAREAASSSSASTAPAPTDNLESEEAGGTESAPVVPQPPRRPGLRGRPIPRAIGKTVSLAAGLVRGVLGRGRTRS